MQVKLLKDIVTSIAGVNATGLVDLLYGKKNVNEFLIAKKLKLNINQTRNILYKLVDEGLVSFIRKKDNKNGGWYTYYWTLDITKSLANLKNVVVKDMKNLQEQIATRQKGTFYHCPNCDMEFDEEQALLHNFTCPECGQVLVLRDNAELISKLQSSLAKRHEQLGIVDVELTALEGKASKTRQRKLKAGVRKKKVERALKRKERDRVMKKIERAAQRKKTKGSKKAKKKHRKR